jgi:thioredoxin-related protein
MYYLPSRFLALILRAAAALVATGILAIPVISNAATAAEPTLSAAQWTTSYEAALQRAKQENKVILADFTGSDWCGWCIALKREVFETDEFKRWASDHAIFLELDFPQYRELSDSLRIQNEDLAEKFRIRGFPTVVLIDGSGREVGRLGYVEGGPRRWIQRCETLLSRNLSQ